MCTSGAVPIEARRGRQVPPELEVQVVVSLLMGVLGSKFVLCQSNPSLSRPLFCGLVCKVCRSHIYVGSV